MVPRIHIPAIALLGLQLTECSSPEDPIVGDWLAVEIDGMAFPATYSEDGNELRFGFTLAIEPDLAGEFTQYYAGEYEDIGVRGEYVSSLVADDDDAPRYLLTITLPEQNVVTSAGEGYADGGYADEGVDGGYADEGAADEGYADGGALLGGAAPHAVTANLRPRAATSTLQLDCTLGAEFLVCKTTASDDDDQPTDWRFARAPEDK